MQQLRASQCTVILQIACWIQVEELFCSFNAITGGCKVTSCTSPCQMLSVKCDLNVFLLLSPPLNTHTHPFHTHTCALSDLLPCNHVKVPGIGGPTGGHPACPQMVGRSEQAVGMVPLAVQTHTDTLAYIHASTRAVLSTVVCVLTARQARLPLCFPTG